MASAKFEAKDPAVLARVVIPMMFAAAAASFLQGLMSAQRLLSGAKLSPEDPNVAMVQGLAYAVYLACAVLTLRWFYRTSANAHLLADGLKISPGWLVAWFFIPVAYLWMPLKGVSETWRASADPRGWQTAPTPYLLKLWWSLWVANAITGNMASMARLEGTPQSLILSDQIQVLASVLQAPLVLVFALMVRQLTAIQLRTLRGHIFQ